MAFKMKGMDFGNKKVDLTKKPVGPRATVKPRKKIDHIQPKSLEGALHNKHADKTEGTIEEQAAHRLSPFTKRKKGDQPYTLEKTQKIEREKGILEDRINLTAAQKKAIAKQKALYDAGKITSAKLESAKREISKYVDY